MKIIVNTTEFKTALEKTFKASALKGSLEVLENVSISFFDDELTLWATDLEKCVVSKIKATADAQEKTFALSDTKTLIKAFKFFKDDTLEIIVFEKDVVFICGNKKAQQDIFQKDECPPLPPIFEVQDIYKYDMDSLKKRIDKVKYAVSKDTYKALFMGIHFNGADMVAIDGYRIALNSDSNLTIKAPFTLTCDSLKVVEDVLENAVEILTDNRKYVSFVSGNCTVTTRIIDGQYMNYKKCFSESKYSVSAKKSEWIENIKYLKASTGSKRPAIKWDADGFHSKELDLKASCGVDSKIPITAISFNGNLMIEALGQFDKKVEELEIKINSALSPLIIEYENDKVLVQPLRL